MGRKASSTTPAPSFIWAASNEEIEDLYRTLDVAFGRDPDAEDPNGGARDDLASSYPAGHYKPNDRIVSFRCRPAMVAKLDEIARTINVPRSDLLFAFVYSELGQYGTFHPQNRLRELAA